MGSPPIPTSLFERAAPRLRITGDVDLPGGARAVLVRVEGRWVITYDRALDDAARRFHIAHELGHLVQCRDRDVVVANYPCGTAASIGERWCDAFAAELLVPQPMLDRAVGDAPLFPSAPVDRIAWENFVDHLHGGAGFNVPRAVMLQQLRLLAAARTHLAAVAFDRLCEASSGRRRRSTAGSCAGCVAAPTSAAAGVYRDLDEQ